MADLSGSYLKIKRANQHVTDLVGEIRSFHNPAHSAPSVRPMNNVRYGGFGSGRSKFPTRSASWWVTPPTT